MLPDESIDSILSTLGNICADLDDISDKITSFSYTNGDPNEMTFRPEQIKAQQKPPSLQQNNFIPNPSTLPPIYNTVTPP